MHDRRPGPAFRKALAAALALGASACATLPAAQHTGQLTASAGGAPETIQILALNDFHGNIEVPGSETSYQSGSERRQELLGGAARLGAALAGLREGQPNTITIAAGDLIGASPLPSAYYLDEPAILALNRMGLELAAVGNHEFDRGTAELRRMQQGGCERHATREPCALDKPFEGARFGFLAANVIDEQGQTLFPGTAIRAFGGVRLGFIGMTLKETATLSSPAGTAGYRFADEADTANAEARRLLDEGADAVVLLIHQGVIVDPYNNVTGCPQAEGDLLLILDRLDPAIRLVVSGHTHNAYVCEVPTTDGTPRLLTSAGRYGAFVTDISMTVDPAADRVLALAATNHPVSAAGGEQADIAALVARYTSAVAPIASRVVGRLEGSFDRPDGDTDSPLGNLIADAQLAAARDPAKGGAQIAFINSGGVRTSFRPAPDGTVTFGQIFALQPFGNTLVVLEMTGAELKRVLEQQFTDAAPAAARSSMLIPSEGFTFAYDRTRPPGERIVELELHGEPIAPDRSYRVAVNNFLSSGGDGFTTLSESRAVGDAGVDIDALEAHIAATGTVPETGRIVDRTPAQ